MFGLIFEDEFLFIIKHVSIKMEAARATTPPNLEGIARKIAYANKKYHSGWMCVGAIKGLAVLKFSTSPNLFGKFKTKIKKRIVVTKIGVESLIE